MFDLTELESLAKINLNEEEKNRAKEYFESWIKRFETLENVKTDGVEPLVTVSSLENVMREDISHKMTDREKLLENSPDQYDGYFVVPRILD